MKYILINFTFLREDKRKQFGAETKRIQRKRNGRRISPYERHCGRKTK
ncbi:MAG: hypothetical protein MJ252_13350 [archaeon]|nr:hypothetical protein [archaeon]